MSDRFDDVGIAWRSFAELLADLLAAAPEGVTIDVIDDRFGDEGPYTQVIRQQEEFDEGPTWLIEASSAQFTSVPTPPDTYTTLRELGYELPDEDSPTHYQVLPVADITLSELAHLMVRTLRDGFSARLTDVFAVSPDFLAHEVLEARSELASAIKFEDFGLRFGFN